ncbi:MAG: LysM peptidoglycan-binding domain-containing protein, partial [Muribaculaceae bacterium]|nr:LysM peptidoglycan-binding domain-containing protein [Muribaculaceae bacterium]
SLYYNPIFEDALERYGLPVELKYLPIIESALNPNAVSRAGAAGLWQFMASTATGEGLEVNSLIDERRDPIKSSDAAAALLKKFYDIYKDWNLVLAAYNCGPGNVNKAIKNSGNKTDYWEIYPYLPKETRGYVPAFIAATYIMNNFGLHGISPAVARAPIVTDTVHVTDRVHFKQISDVMGLSMDELRILNPQYRQDIIPGNIKPYTLILPSVQAYCYKANIDSILGHDRSTYATRTVAEPAVQTEPTVKYHTVKKGETLKSIAALYGVTQGSIMSANRMKSTTLKIGKKLKIEIAPAESAYSSTDTAKTQSTNTRTNVADASREVTTPTSPTPEPQTTAPAKNQNQTKPKANSDSHGQKKQQTTTKTTTYKVKKGDTLYSIASRNGVSVDELKRANGLKSDKLAIDQTLKIPAKAKSAPKKNTPAKKTSSKKRR